MAYTLSTGDIIEVRINYEANGQKLLNVFHYKVSANGTANNGATELAYALNKILTDPTYWAKVWQASGATNTKVVNSQAQKIWPIRYPAVSQNPNLTGLNNSDQLPQNVQLSIEKVGELANRHGVGRVEVPGITLEMVVDGDGSAAAATWLSALAATMILQPPANAGATVLLIPVIYNRSSPSTSQLITALKPQQSSRVARRRTLRVGQ